MMTIQRDLTILSQPPIYILLELHIIFISLIIYKPSTLIISPQTFSMQLGAGISLFCLFQCAIPFCTLSTLLIQLICSYSYTPKFYLTRLDGSSQVVLEYNWLSDYNPNINQKESVLTFTQMPKPMNPAHKVVVENLEKEKSQLW